MMGYRDMLRLRDVFPRVLDHVEYQMSTVERQGVRAAELDSLLMAVDTLGIALKAVLAHPSAPEILGSITEGQVASATKVNVPRDWSMRVQAVHNADENGSDPDHNPPPRVA